MDREDAEKLFGELYDATYRRVFAFVFSRIKDTGDTDDVLQTVYAAFFRRLLTKGALDEDSAVKILFTAARHELSRCYGVRQRERDSVYLDDEELGDKLEFELSQNVPDVMGDDRLALEAIWKEVEAKGELTKRLFVLHYSYGLSVADCAKQLEITPANATSRIYRTIKDIREKMEGSERV